MVALFAAVVDNFANMFLSGKLAPGITKMIEQKVLVRTQEVEIVEFRYNLPDKHKRDRIYITPISAALDQAVENHADNRAYSHFQGYEDNSAKFFKRLIIINNN